VEEVGNPPGEAPLLCIRQVDGAGPTLGEIWISPSDLFRLREFLMVYWLLRWREEWREVPEGPRLELE
jgi:hypothetical protein